MARPKKKIDLAQVEKLASWGCTHEEIAWIVGVDVSTISRRKAQDDEFCMAIKKGAEQGKKELRQAMQLHAMKGNAALLIFLAKNRLGMRDRPDIDDTMEIEADGRENVSVDVSIPSGKSVTVTFRQESSVKEINNAVSSGGPEDKGPARS